MSSYAEQLEAKNYAYIDKLIEGPLLDVAFQYTLMRLENEDMQQEGDFQVPDTPMVLGDRMMEALLGYLQPRMEEITGKRLYPTYSCLRVYKHGDTLPRHIDRPACEFSVTLCLGYDADYNWPIKVGDKDNPSALEIKPGDGVVYKGCDLPHWREAFEGVTHSQVFLHYVDADGPNAHCKLDGRERLGQLAS